MASAAVEPSSTAQDATAPVQPDFDARSAVEAAALRDSEAKYRSLFQTMSEGFCIIEKSSRPGEPTEFRWLEVNPAFERHTGGASLVGKSLADTFPESRDAVEMYDTVLQTGKPARFELNMTRFGTVLDLHAFPMYGSISRVAVLLQDITEHRRAQRRQTYSLKLSDALRPLGDATEIHNTAMRVLGEHLGVTRAQYYVADASGEYVESLGGHAGSLPAKLGRFRLNDFGQHVAANCRSGRNIVIASVALNERRSAVPPAFNAFVGVPLLKGGKLVGLLGVDQEQPREWSPDDVHCIEETAERVWLALERANAEAALRESDKRKDEYLAMLGHELRNPLGAIRNASELLIRADSEDSRVRRAASVLQRQSIHMSRIIDGLLDVSRIARGKITLELEPLDLRRVIEAVLDGRKPEIESRGLDLELQSAPEPLWVVGDDARLVQIVDNLVGNAIKFTHAGGSIAVGIRGDDTHAVISVRDTGIGIRPEILPTVFEPFQQDTQDVLRASDGLGLGLSLAHGLVALHQGTIAAHSAGPGKGTEIVVRLPLTAARAAVSGNDAAEDGRAVRILVVEDNSDAAEMLCLLLQGFGHEVVIAETAGEALERLAQRSFDIALCDVGLPDMSGLDLARMIRRDPARRGLVLIALTGYGQPQDRCSSAEAGFDDHLTKPVSLAALKAALCSVRDNKLTA